MMKRIHMIVCSVLLAGLLSGLWAGEGRLSAMTAASAAPTDPGGFPDDIPIPDGAMQVDIPQGFKVENGRRSKLVSYSVKTTMVRIERLYKEYLRIKGYNEDVNKPGDKAMTLSGSLNETTLSIAASVDANDGTIVHVRITWTSARIT
ncbi:hypothetical protein ACFPYJ_12010 [Paenibacillus solisilvae]|uniref:Uncharacterized protein n=1 Tax=Paenibacillus solisilvae TaxID=2486751 RepID=A0ABW0VYN3_9BACL